LDGLRFVCLFGNKQYVHFVSFQHPLRCTSRVRGVGLSSVLSFGTGSSHMSNDGINNVKTACGSGSGPSCEYTNILLCVQYYHNVRYTIPRHPPPPQNLHNTSAQYALWPSEKEQAAYLPVAEELQRRDESVLDPGLMTRGSRMVGCGTLSHICWFR
jgi:hypothetical protein